MCSGPSILWVKNLSSPNPCLIFPCHDCCSIVLQISTSTCKRHNDAIKEAAFSKRMQPTSHRNSNLILHESSRVSPSCIDKLCKECVWCCGFVYVLRTRTSSLSDPPCREKEQEMTGSYSEKKSSAALEQSSTLIAVYNAYLDYTLLHGHQETVFETF